MGPETAFSPQPMYPLSPEQRRILRQPLQTLDRIEFQIDRELAHAELTQAFGRLVQEHDILRTGFWQREGVSLPWQRPGLPYTPDIPVDSHAAEPQTASPARLQGQPLACCSAQASSGRTTIVLSLPAACSDAHTLLRIAAELAGRCARETGPESNRRIPGYLRYSAWRNTLCANRSGDPAVFRDSAQDDEADWATFESPAADSARDPMGWTDLEALPGLSGQLRAAAEKRQVSPSDLLLTIWTLWLARHYERTPFRLSLIADRRTRDPLLALLGPATAVLPLTARIEPGAGFDDLCRNLAAQAARLREHAPFFPDDRENGPGIGFEWIDSSVAAPARVQDIITSGDGCPVKLVGVASPAGLRLRLLFRTQFYRMPEMKACLEGFLGFTTRLVPDPAGLDQIETLGPAQQQQMANLGRGPRQRVQYGTGPELLRLQAELNPGGAAVIGPSGALGFGEFWRDAQMLAQDLGPPDPGEFPSPVAIMLDAECRLPVAMAAAWLSGRPYLPLHSSNPAPRIRQMIAETKVRIVLAERRHHELFRGFDGRLLEADAGSNPIKTNLPRLRDASWPAYLIFTSGTTGTPKGTLISHGALANYVSWLGATFSVGPGDRSLLLTSAAFDLGYTALWGTLMNGATLILPDEQTRSDASRWLPFIVENGVTFLKLTPSMFHALMSNDGKERLRHASHLRLIILGGEPVRVDDIAEARRLRPDLTFVNHYGPTEATIGCVVFRIDPGRLDEFRRRPVIGRPISNADAYILDSGLRPVPRGVTGNLYIGGHGLASGYAAQPEATAASFIPNPFGNGERIYRTGDRARWTADGSMEYLGRADLQLKLSGYRVEPSEVESALLQHPGITAAAVFPSGEAGRQTLVAVMVPDMDHAAVTARLCRLAPEPRRGLRTLPNGLMVSSYRDAETDLLYREIFVDRIYTRHGVHLSPGDVVIDAGANIGMFSLWAAMTAPGARIYACEPVPATFAHLQTNAELFPVDWRIFPVALGDACGRAAFTCYRDHSLLATRHPDEESDSRLLAAMAASRHGQDEKSPALLSLIEEQMTAESIDAEMTTLSRLISDHAINHIDLLKVDVQRDEFLVLEGIEEADWQRIRQLVVEVHDRTGSADVLADRLRRRGFLVAIEGGGAAANEHRLIYAARPASARGERVERPVEQWLPPASLAESVRRTVAGQLPDYMVPGRYWFVAALPITANGKIDRAALPALQSEALNTDPALTPPDGEPARTLARLWREVLQVDAVGLESNFFNCGGHSLLAAQLANRIREALGIHLRLAELLRRPLFADMAALLHSGAERVPEPVGMAPERSYDPLTPAQRGLFFLAQTDEGNTAYNVARAFLLNGEIDAGLLQRSINDVVRRHDALRTAFTALDGDGVQRVIPAALPALHLDRHCPETLAEAALLVEAEARKPFALEQPPLLRACLFELPDQRHILSLVTHHIVSDGWSVEILVRDLFERYAVLKDDPRAGWPGLPFQFRDAVHHRTLSLERKPHGPDHGPYWLSKLSGPRWSDSLPADFQRPQKPSFEGSMLRFALDGRAWRSVLSACRDLEISPFVMLLASLDVLLHLWTGREDIVVATNSSGRDDGHLENQVGYYAETLLQRNAVRDDDPFSALLKRVASTAVEALEHHEFTFEELVRRIAVLRRNGTAVLFDVGFTWYDIIARADIRALGRRAGLAAEPWFIEYFPARADLWFFANPEPEGLSWHLVYDRCLFRRETIEALRFSLLRILDCVVTNPDVKIRDIDANLPSRAAGPGRIELRFE